MPSEFQAIHGGQADVDDGEAVMDGKGIMKDFVYLDGARLQPPDEQVRKMRPAH